MREEKLMARISRATGTRRRSWFGCSTRNCCVTACGMYPAGIWQRTQFRRLF